MTGIPSFYGSPLPSMMASLCFVVLAFLLLPAAFGRGFSAVVDAPASESIGVPTAEGFADGSSKCPSPKDIISMVEKEHRDRVYNIPS